MRHRQFALGVVLLASALLATTPLAAAALDQHGDTHSWRGATGHYTVIDFAASWCGPCWKTLPKLEELAEAHPAVVFLVVSVDDEVKGRDRLVADVPLTLPTLWDEDYAIAEHYRPEAMPATFVLDPEGELIYHHAGSTEKDWRALVDLLTKIPPKK
jgi:thiol-disulfide isomerase/thioredoxin